MSVLRKVKTLLDRLWIRLFSGVFGFLVLSAKLLVAGCAGHHNRPSSVELGLLNCVLGSLLHLGLRPWPGHQR